MPGAEPKQTRRERKEELAPHIHTIKAFWQDNREEITSRKRQVLGYGNRLKNAVKQAALLLIIIAGLTAGILYMLGVLWELYAETPMGRHFIGYFPDRAWEAYDLLDRNPLDFALKITIQAFFICLMCGGAGRLTGLIRRFYLPVGKGPRVLFWGIPLVVIVASNIQYMHDIEMFETALAAALLPTLGVFPACFQLAVDLLPEGGGLIRMAADLVTRHTR